MLERSVAQANSFFMDHNLMLGVINVGGLLSRSKLLVPMLYFDTSQCRVSSGALSCRRGAGSPQRYLISGRRTIAREFTHTDTTATATATTPMRDIKYGPTASMDFANKSL